ncbi:MAG: carbohydrate ABC transporter permease [Actinobacteria bacterium]|nr:carbohydrate ABC transporter permease [Actinomycetota bacterium]
MKEGRLIKKFDLNKLLIYFLLIITAILIILPILFIFINSFKGIVDFTKNVFGLPHEIQFGNYSVAWEQGNFFRLISNSLIITIISVAALIFLGALASYPIARKKLFGGNFIYVLFLSGLMIPPQVIAIPLFILEKKLGLLNTLPGLIFVYIAAQLPITVFIFVGFMRGIPVEIEEASHIDGCSNIGTFWRIIFPLVKPAIATVSILGSLNIWNDFFYPLILINTKENMTVTLGLFAFRSFFRVTFTNLFAYMSSMIIPMIILYLVLQKFIIKGMTAGAVKG